MHCDWLSKSHVTCASANMNADEKTVEMRHLTFDLIEGEVTDTYTGHAWELENEPDTKVLGYFYTEMNCAVAK